MDRQSLELERRPPPSQLQEGQGQRRARHQLPRPRMASSSGTGSLRGKRENSSGLETWPRRWEDEGLLSGTYHSHVDGGRAGPRGKDPGTRSHRAAWREPLTRGLQSYEPDPSQPDQGFLSLSANRAPAETSRNGPL